MYGLPDSWAGWAAKKAVRSSSSGGSGRGSGIRTVTTTYTKTNITYKFSHVVINEPNFYYVFNSPIGTVGKVLHGLGDTVVLQAKAQAGVRTGALKRSIHMRHLGNASGQYLWIGSTKSYAYEHHEGTKPHIERSKPGGTMVFRSGSKIIHTREVRHPGTKPNRYLSDQLRVFKI